ncbi:helix-turn-helix domain-containing protein [Mesorhizobium sp. M2A.F.Ca.ET.067.02.1.1]|uniref:helix-turn-helix domain-containing protein n=1 Tax=Mesorhizobium sp. M2A.F.Ca.ET.067.02.1.1 TaxID=2496749 RepID=UPI000FD4D09E|nr:helix-turn-helix domain-containing protein [Mesorhizobium sp. M2A.F.Ca.ET.067.02.1.1]RUW81490.1 helix-turn-helix domain-containing protein [Mesorhizobium sp. M2A.F.Ca.ET.067.02.1.1]TIU58009.1 MAG: helix-turn-helix domain-containing protein [Mesorhizobium sp.]
MTQEKRRASTAWSWRHAFAQSDLPPTTRLLLHTLGMFMNELGEDCIPSIADLCRYSGLDKRTVVRHLAAAKEAGWIGVSQHGFRGQKWKRNQYAPRWPERDLMASMIPDNDVQGGGRESPPSPVERGGTESPPSGKGGGTESPKVGAQSHQDNTSPITSPIERERAMDDFDHALKRWPVVDSPKAARRAWNTLSPAERIEAAREIDRFVAVNRSAGRKLICSFTRYLAERMWLALPERPKPLQPRPAAPAKPAGPSPFERKHGWKPSATEAKP